MRERCSTQECENLVTEEGDRCKPCQAEYDRAHAEFKREQRNDSEFEPLPDPRTREYWDEKVR